MEIRNEYAIPIGLAIVICLSLLFLWRNFAKQSYKKGIKAANLEDLKKDKLYRRKMLEYTALRIAVWTSIVGVIMSSSYVLARPYVLRQTTQERYTRDIIICLDVSTSVNELNMKLTRELQDTVMQLKGERVGIVMFNTSPVLVAPLSDDYEYTVTQLENIRHAIKVTDSNYGGFSDDWSYWNDFLFSGTLVGNEERGSSLIGDGLLGAVFNFSQYEPKRTKIVIFATDNDPYGEPFKSLPEAAEICKKNNIVVYGIGTKDMTTHNRNEMEQAMLATGGKFYLEEDSSTFSNIVEDIESQSASLIKGKTIIKEIEQPLKGYKALCFFLALSILCSIVLLRFNAPWLFRQAIAIAVTVALFFLFVKPALNNYYGDDVDVETNSDLNVLFVVDSTLSMAAQDYNGEEERLSGVKTDCAEIIDELQGAKFGVVTFNNTANLASPYTTNYEHVKNVIFSIYPVEALFARGTNMNITKDKLLEILEKSSQNEEQKTVVFFISDGEVTSDDMLQSYSELAPYIDGGAVLGYGTEQGGKMFVQGLYEEEPRQVMDKTTFPYEEAISRIDEGNLKRIAGDLGIDYINMNTKEGLSPILNNIKSDIHVTYEVDEKDDQDNKNDETDKVIFRFNNDWWMLAGIILVIYTFEGISIIRKKA